MNKQQRWAFRALCVAGFVYITGTQYNNIVLLSKAVEVLAVEKEILQYIVDYYNDEIDDGEEEFVRNLHQRLEFLKVVRNI